MEQDWAYLEADTLSLILDKLEERMDHVRFGFVCKNWCSAAKLNHQNKEFRSNVLPMLMIPTESESTMKKSLYDIQGNRLYPFRPPMLPDKRFCGSSHGWLATVEDDDDKCVITLINPFKNVARIVLPPLETPVSNVNRVVLSVDPLTNPNDYEVAVIHNFQRCLAFIRAGQKIWTHVQDIDSGYRDITFYKGLICAVCKWNYIVSFNLYYSDDDTCGREKIAPNIFRQGNHNGTDSYFVKSLEGDLWMVRGFSSQLNGEFREGFHVFKLELDVQNGKVLQMSKLENLGDNVLFIDGHGNSIVASSSYFSNCIQKDTIYYTHNYDNEKYDLRVYNVKERIGDKHYFRNPSLKCMPAVPFWIRPLFPWD